MATATKTQLATAGTDTDGLEYAIAAGRALLAV